MALLADWTDDRKDEFLRFQFEAQDRHYREHYRDARFDVIVLDGVDAGRLYVQRKPGEIRVMDICLLPEHRGRGIGSTLMGEILEEARRTGCFVSLFVEENNPARRLYQRMGFEDAGEVTFYKRMHWTPAGAGGADQAKTAS